MFYIYKRRCFKYVISYIIITNPYTKLNESKKITHVIHIPYYVVFTKIATVYNKRTIAKKIVHQVNYHILKTHFRQR